MRSLQPCLHFQFTSAFESVCLLLTCSERNHPEPCEGHQCVMEPVADGCAHTGQ